MQMPPTSVLQYEQNMYFICVKQYDYMYVYFFYTYDIILVKNSNFCATIWTKYIFHICKTIWLYVNMFFYTYDITLVENSKFCNIIWLYVSMFFYIYIWYYVCKIYLCILLMIIYMIFFWLRTLLASIAAGWNEITMMLEWLVPERRNMSTA